MGFSGFFAIYLKKTNKETKPKMSSKIKIDKQQQKGINSSGFSCPGLQGFMP